MTDFWKTALEDVGGPLTPEAWERAMEGLRKQSDAYYCDYRPPYVVLPPGLVKK